MPNDVQYECVMCGARFCGHPLRLECPACRKWLRGTNGACHTFAACVLVACIVAVAAVVIWEFSV